MLPISMFIFHNFLDSFGHCTQLLSILFEYKTIKIKYLPHVDKYLTFKYKYKYPVLHLWKQSFNTSDTQRDDSNTV